MQLEYWCGDSRHHDEFLTTMYLHTPVWSIVLKPFICCSIDDHPDGSITRLGVETHAPAQQALSGRNTL